MIKWQEILVSPLTPIISAIKLIDTSSMQIALVVDENNRLLGTVTDGDVRRGILKGVSLEEPLHKIMNPNPTVSKLNEGRDSILAVMRHKQIRHIPVVDENGCVVSLEILDEMIKCRKRENIVVLMAGGMGIRLRPLTDECPKPLLKVGDKPLLENILNNFIEYGFSNFYFSVNYKAEMIKDYFGNGTRWGVEIRYIHEDMKMGTAGALGLLPEKPVEPIIVMNGDLLTKVNFQGLIDFHREHRAYATMCVREYNIQVPYGVVKIDKHRLIGIDEKPVQHFFVNAGIYVLEPDTLKIIPRNTSFDMPCLFEKIIANNFPAAVFPVREYWIDIGQIDDLRRANGDFKEVFG